jgi:hypothetical protein
MGTILQFARRTEPALQSAESDGARGVIIIFPGVRIERHGAGKAPKGAATQARKRAPRKKQRR